MTTETPAPSATPTARAPRSIPVELARDAGALIGTFLVLLVLRWAFQHHTPDAIDAQFFWFFTPLFLAIRWWRLARERRASDAVSLPTARSKLRLRSRRSLLKP